VAEQDCELREEYSTIHASMNTKQIIGYVLLAVGVGIIGYALVASYGIFTGSSEAPKLFQESVGEQTGRVSTGSDEEQQIENLLQEQLAKLLPQDTIVKTLNLFAWSILTGILIFGGSQIAGIGVRLLVTRKTEKV